MNRYALLVTGVVVLSAGLAVVIGSQLPEQYQGVGFGLAAGTLLGTLMGGILVFFLLRRGASQQTSDHSIHLQLTPEQAHYLFKALERQQASPESQAASSRGERQFKTVGGAEISPYDSTDA